MAKILQQLQRRILLSVLSLTVAIAGFLLLTTPAYAQLEANIAQLSHQASATERARAVLHNAYEHRYTWDEKFPGYLTEVSLRYNKTLYRGLAQVNPDLSVNVSIDEAVRQLVTEQLQMVTIHHRRVPFEAIHGQHTFQLAGTDDTGALQIQEIGDGIDSHYKVRNQKITQVNRDMGPVAVTVNTLGFFTPPEGYLVAHYQSIFCDAQTGAELEQQDVRDIYDKVGKYYLLTRRYIRPSNPDHPTPGLEADILMSFDAIQLLQKSTA